MPNIEPDEIHQFTGIFPPGFRRADIVDDQGLRDDVEDRHPRVERPVGVLKHELKLTAKRDQFLLAERQHVAQLSAIIVGDRTMIRGDSPHQHFRQGRLAATAFTNQAKRFTAMDVEAHTVNRDNLAVVATTKPTAFADGERFVQILDLEDRPGIVSPFRPGLLFRVEEAAGRLDRADRHQPLAGRHVEARHCVLQRLQIRVLRIAEDMVESPRLHDLAVIHDDDLIGHVGDDA